MVKFAILFHTPKNLQTFENGYNGFLAAVETMPNITRRQVNTIIGSPMQNSPFYRVLELYFDDFEALNAALNSENGQKAGLAMMNSFEQGSFETFFADVYEEAGARTEP